jgi:hypothetical protein
MTNKTGEKQTQNSNRRYFERRKERKKIGWGREKVVQNDDK